MLINKNISVWSFLRISYKPITFIAIYSTLIVILFSQVKHAWISLPWQVLTVIGTAVSLYLGFKNNQAYQRMWEARKIWGSIVNSSRIWGTQVHNFVTDQFQTNIKTSPYEIEKLKLELINRHIAWIYRLRRQLWKPTEWEDQSRRSSRTRKQMFQHFAPLSEREELEKYLDKKEVDDQINKSNIATQLIAEQGQALKELKEKGLIDDFRHMEMMKTLRLFFDHQGKCERIKNFPLPRQYSSFSFAAVQIFIIMIPIGLFPLFNELGGLFVWGTIPAATLISWIFWMMERVGDITENPFQGLVTDIPMTSICRTIEKDLQEMSGIISEIPPIKSINDVLM